MSLFPNLILVFTQKHDNIYSEILAFYHLIKQGRPDRGPRAQIWAPDRLFFGPFRFKIYALNLGLWALSQLMTTIGHSHKKFESVQLYRESVPSRTIAHHRALSRTIRALSLTKLLAFFYTRAIRKVMRVDETELISLAF